MNKKRIWGILVGVFSLLLVTGTAFADVDYSPGKFAKDGTIGKKHRLRQIYTVDLNYSGQESRIITISGTTGAAQANNDDSVTGFLVDLSAGNLHFMDPANSGVTYLSAGETGVSIFLVNATSGTTPSWHTLVYRSGTTDDPMFGNEGNYAPVLPIESVSGGSPFPIAGSDTNNVVHVWEIVVGLESTGDTIYCLSKITAFQSE